MKANTVEATKNFKGKDGYWRILMIAHEGCRNVKVKVSRCYPANQKGKYIEYTDNSYEVSRDEANKMFIDYKKKRYTVKVG